MSETFLIVVLLLLYIVIREVIIHRQVTRLHELIKSDSFREFNDYTEKSQPVGKRYWGKDHGNLVMEELPNEISVDDPEFDISKVSQVSINGEEKPVSIL